MHRYTSIDMFVPQGLLERVCQQPYAQLVT